MGTIALSTIEFSLAFILPGFLASRLLGITTSLIFVTSYAISLLILFHSIFWLQVSSQPINRISVTAVLLAVTIAMLSAIYLWRKNIGPLRIGKPGWSHSKHALWIAFIALMMVLAVRINMAPLLGADTFFRWDFLAHKILEYQHFSFYPPTTPDDYKIYFYTDSIPPLVSFSYFWMYALSDGTDPSLTTGLVILQFISLLLLGYHIARSLFGHSSGRIACTLMLTSPLVLHAVAIGQETGYTVMAAGGVVYYAGGLNEKRGKETMIVAGCFAALGALSREYGWIFLIGGGILTLLQKRSKKDCLVFILSTLFIAFPWYARTWMITGNPFYSNSVGTLFPVNTTHIQILETYSQSIGFGVETKTRIIAIARYIFFNAPLAITFGLIGIVIFKRKMSSIVTIGSLSFLVWVYSVEFTANNFISTRVLSPVIFLLTVIGSGWLAALSARGIVSSLVVKTILVLAYIWSLFIVAIYPSRPTGFTFSNWKASLFQRRSNTPKEIALIGIMNHHVPDTSTFRVLSGNAYAHAALATVPVDVVPVWSPEIQYIFDDSLDASVIRERLRAANIYAVLYYPNSLNTRYLNQFRFFREDRKNWVRVVDRGTYSVYLLPP